MKITRHLSLLYSLAISWGFSPDSTWTRRRHDRQPYSFQRAHHHPVNANQLVHFAATKNNNRLEHLNDNHFHKETSERTATKVSKRATASSKIASGSSSVEKQQRDGDSVLKSKQKVSKPGQVRRAKITDGDVRKDNNLLQMRWDARLNQLIEYKQKHGDCLVPYEFEENPPLGIWVSKQRYCYNQEPKTISEERIQRLEEIGFEWDALKAQWELRFWHLVEYKRQHGDCLVPSDFQENLQLPTWVETQRQRYKREPKTIPDDQIQRLESIGFEWDPLKAQWESRFQQLVAYKQQHGNCLVPSEFEENPQLGLWVVTQRQSYKSESKNLSHDQIQRLEEIGFEWDPLKAQWELRFQQLVEYKHQHGNCLVPYEFEGSRQLGRWVDNQRQSYKSENKNLSHDQIQRLEEIGFEWDPLKAQWESHFQQLIEYKQKHGDCLVPSGFQENLQLGTWVETQRQRYKREPKTIPDDQIQRLEHIGFEWDAQKAQWDLRFQQLVEYKQQHGDCLVSSDFEENCQLGKWVSKQRYCYNKRVPKDEISKDRIQRLEEIGFEWDAFDALWELRFQQLVRYKQKHGDCLVPNKFEANPQLGMWVARQRSCYKRAPKAISNNRIERLEAIGFEWTGWRLRFDETMRGDNNN